MQIKKLFTKSEFTRNTLVLVIGTIIAQTIPFLLHPFLRRIYSAEDFGAMAVFLSVFSMITIISSLRYEPTIVLPSYDNEAKNILSLTFLINIVFNLTALIIVILYKGPLSNFIGLSDKYKNYLYLLPITSFLYSFYQSLNFWLVRKKAFKASSTNKVVRRLVEGVVQLSFGLIKIPGGLFFGDMLGNFSNVLSGIRQVLRHSFSLKQVSKRRISFVLKKYIDYPKYNALPTLLSSAGTLLPFLFINKLYSTELVGYLDLSRMVLSIPLVFISTTISQVLFQQITSYKHQQRSIRKEVLNILFLLLSIIFIEFVFLFLFGDELFGFIFGEDYILSSQFSKLLIFSFSLNFITSTFSSIFITFNKIKLNAIWQFFYFVSICLLLLFKGFSVMEFVKIYVTIEVVMHSINLIMLLVIITKYEQNIRKC